MSKSTTVSEFRRRRKNNLVKVSGEKCNLCGYNITNSALEFHHIDANTKLYGVASNGTCHDLESDLAEIKKCILVCANCHREIHDGNYTPEELWIKQKYNEKIAEQLREEKIQTMSKTHHFCKDCNKEIQNIGVTGMCEDCYKKSQRAGRPSRDELKKMIRTLPFTKIGESFGVTDNAIRKWCKVENLPSKKTEINALTDEQWSKI